MKLLIINAAPSFGGIIDNEESDMGSRGREAYEYIRDVANIRCDSPDEELAKLADRLGGTFGLKDDLMALRDGISGPSERLIRAFKSSFGTIPESTVNAKLIEPFLSEPFD